MHLSRKEMIFSQMPTFIVYIFIKSMTMAAISPGTGEFPAQMASYAENVSIWWRHHEPDRSGLSIAT